MSQKWTYVENNKRQGLCNTRKTLLKARLTVAGMQRFPGENSTCSLQSNTACRSMERSCGGYPVWSGDTGRCAPKLPTIFVVKTEAQGKKCKSSNRCEEQHSPITQPLQEFEQANVERIPGLTEVFFTVAFRE